MNVLTSKIRNYIFGPRMHEVDSSAIQAIGYDRRRHSMLVRFTSDRVYEYGCVDKSLFRRFLESDSKGRFFNREIRARRYPFIEVPQDFHRVV